MMKLLLTTTALSIGLAAPLYAETAKPDETTMTSTSDAAETTRDTDAEMAESASQAAEDIGDTASDAATAVENTAEDLGEAASSAAETASDFVADTADATGDVTRDALDGTSDERAEAMPMEGYQVVPATEVTAGELDGARVYDANSEWIGEVSKIVMDPDGAVDTLIVDVGGFLGMGEKPVGLDFSAFQLQKAVEGNEIRASVKATKEQLESMPEYDG